MANSIIGISFESGRVRAVEVRSWRGGRPVVVNASEGRLLSSSFNEGGIVEPGDVRDALIQLVAEGDFGTNDVVLVVDGRQAMVRRSNLPAQSKSDLRMAAQFDIEELLGYPVNESVFDVATISSIEQGGVAWVSALVVAVRQRTIDQLGSVVRAAGLEDVAAHWSAEALVRSVRSAPVLEKRSRVTDGSLSDNTLTAIVNVGDSQTDIVIRDENGVTFSRTLASGVGEAARSAVEELESHLRDLVGDSPQSWVAESRPGVGTGNVSFARILDGVERTLRYYRTEIDEREVVEIVLSGSRCTVPGLCQFLSDGLGTDVSLSAPPDAWSGDAETWFGYEIAYGAVLCQSRSSAGASRSFNLTPWEARCRSQNRKRYGASMVVLVVLLSLLAPLTMAKREALASVQGQVDQASETVAALGAELDELDDVGFQYSILQSASEQADFLLGQEVDYALVLQEVASVLPEDARLVSVQMRRAAEGETVAGYETTQPIAIVTFNGEAVDLEAVSVVLDAIGSTTLVEAAWLTQSTTTLTPDSPDDGRTGALFAIEGVLTSRSQPQRTVSTDEWTS